MLALEPSAELLAEVRAHLTRLAAEDAVRFERLFSALQPHQPAPLEAAMAHALEAIGLVTRAGGELWQGAHRLRRVGGDRFYALELGAHAEYRQDVWPETDALLAAVATLPATTDGRPTRLCEIGTGCGVVAIEAARRGLAVVATDLFPGTLALARWNAALNLDGARSTGTPVDRAGALGPTTGTPVDRAGALGPTTGTPVDRAGALGPTTGTPVDRAGALGPTTGTPVDRAGALGPTTGTPVGHAIDFRLGDMYAPVQGERFDVIASAPHYTRVADQLRWSTLLGGVEHLAPRGRLVVATFFEWLGDEPLAVEPAWLRPLAARGFDVLVEPLDARVKSGWFTAVEGPADWPVPSRGRFLAQLTAPAEGAQGAGRYQIVRHAERALALPRERLVPMARLRVGAGPAGARGGDVAVVRGADDVARIEALLGALGDGVVELRGQVPAGMVDACRFGKARCVSEQRWTGAAGAILDARGEVRPCAWGEPLGRLDDSLDELLLRQRARAAATESERGCAECAVADACSRCLFPTPLGEGDYCDFMRRAGSAPLRDLGRLWDVLVELERRRAPSSAVWLKVKPAVRLLAASGRPLVVDEQADADEPMANYVRWLRQHCREQRAWLVRLEPTRFLLFWGELYSVSLSRTEAALIELVLEGHGARALESYAQGYISADEYRAALTQLGAWVKEPVSAG